MLNRLKTVARDIRVNRAPRRVITHSAALAPFIFRSARPATVVQHNHWHSHILLAVRAETPEARKDLPAPRRAKYSTSMMVRRVTRRDEVVERVARRQTTEVAERILRRRVRIEAGTASPYKAVAPSVPAGAQAMRAAVPMIMRTPPPQPPTADAPHIAESVVSLPNRQARPLKPDLDQIDMNRLTQQVVAAIDRRITARRERTGRH